MRLRQLLLGSGLRASGPRRAVGALRAVCPRPLRFCISSPEMAARLGLFLGNSRRECTCSMTTKSKLRASPTAWPRGYRAGSLSVSSQQCFVFIATGPCCFKLEKHRFGKVGQQTRKRSSVPTSMLALWAPSVGGALGQTGMIQTT